MNWAGLVAAGKEGYKAYETVKGRKDHHVVNSKCCGKTVSTFVKAGYLDGPGGRSGACGTQKDNHRVYCCQGCFNKFWK